RSVIDRGPELVLRRVRNRGPGECGIASDRCTIRWTQECRRSGTGLRRRNDEVSGWRERGGTCAADRFDIPVVAAGGPVCNRRGVRRLFDRREGRTGAREPDAISLCVARRGPA